MSNFIDFAALKAAVSIEQTAQLLGITLKQEGQQFRSACPACQSGGDRAIVVTPAKGLFFCFSSKKGGDVIGLAAHVMNVGNNDAAHFLADQLGTESATAPQKPAARSQPSAPKKEAPFDAEAFAAKLEYASDTDRALLIGKYRNRNYRGHRYQSGSIAGFSYEDEHGKTVYPKNWQPDTSNVVKLPKRA